MGEGKEANSPNISIFKNSFFFGGGGVGYWVEEVQIKKCG